MRVETNITCCL